MFSLTRNELGVLIFTQIPSPYHLQFSPPFGLFGVIGERGNAWKGGKRVNKPQRMRDLIKSHAASDEHLASWVVGRVVWSKLHTFDNRCGCCLKAEAASRSFLD